MNTTVAASYGSDYFVSLRVRQEKGKAHPLNNGERMDILNSSKASEGAA
jgi:hypothetical protein